MVGSTFAPRRGMRRRVFLLLAIFLVFGALLAAYRIGVDRGFESTIGRETWGRVLFAVGAAITRMDHGGYGYTLSTVIETVLTYGGLTDNPKILNELGTKYPDNLRDTNLINSAIDKAARFKFPFNPEQAVRGSGGDDLGFVDYVRVGFLLFGHRLQSLYFAYFLFLGISVAAFIVTFRLRPEYLALLVITCVAHAALFASGLFDSARALLADPRCLGILAVIPGLHIACLMLSRIRLSVVDQVLAAVQAAILVFAFWIRASAVWVIVGLALVASLIALEELRRHRRLPLARLQSVAILLAVLAAHTLYVVVALHPVYRQKGEISRHVFWHAVFYQLQHHPQWKNKYGAQFDNAIGDQLPQQAAKKYLAKHPSSDPDIYLTADRSYLTVAAGETYARKAFFDFLINDPIFVFEAAFWYKSKAIADILAEYLGSLFRASAIGYATAAAVFVVVGGALAAGGAAEYGRFAGGVLLLTGAFFVSLLPVVLTTPAALMVEQYYALLIAFGGWVVLILAVGLRRGMQLAKRARAGLQSAG